MSLTVFRKETWPDVEGFPWQQCGACIEGAASTGSTQRADVAVLAGDGEPQGSVCGKGEYAPKDREASFCGNVLH